MYEKHLANVGYTPVTHSGGFSFFTFKFNPNIFLQFLGQHN